MQIIVRDGESETKIPMVLIVVVCMTAFLVAFFAGIAVGSSINGFDPNAKVTFVGRQLRR